MQTQIRILSMLGRKVMKNIIETLQQQRGPNIN